MFKKGDVVRIKEDFLDKGEDPSKDYIVFESYEDRTKVFSHRKSSAFGGDVYVWATNMFYKVGHIELEG